MFRNLRSLVILGLVATLISCRDGGSSSSWTVTAAVYAPKALSLSWTAQTGAASYNIYRGTTSGFTPTTPIANTAEVSYTDTGLTTGTKYYYILKSANGSGTETATSEEASGTPVFAGTLDTSFGSEGVVTIDFGLGGGLDGNYFIKFDSDNNIIVAGRTLTTPKLWKFDTNGTLVPTFGTGGEVQISSDTEVDVTGLTIDTNNNIYIAAGVIDPGIQGEILEFDENGTLVMSATPSDAGETVTVSSVYGAAIASDGTAYFAGNRVITGETSLAIWELLGNNDSRVFAKACINLGCGANDLLIYNDSFYLLGNDYGGTNINIWKINSDGTTDTNFGASGQATFDTSGVASSPAQLAVDSNGDIFATGFVGDDRSDPPTAAVGIWKYNSVSKELETFFPSTETTGTSNGIAFDDENNVFMTGVTPDEETPGNATIWVADSTGEAITSLFTSGVYTDTTNLFSFMNKGSVDYLGRLVVTESATDGTSEEDLSASMKVMRFK